MTSPSTPPAPAARGPRVLLAEDEALIRLDLKEMLQEEGYDVVGEVGDGESAVKLAEQLRPDLIILDVKMPGMDGITAAERIAEHPDRPGRDPHRLQPARPRRAGPRRRRDGVPGEAVPEA